MGSWEHLHRYSSRDPLPHHVRAHVNSNVFLALFLDLCVGACMKWYCNCGAKEETKEYGQTCELIEASAGRTFAPATTAAVASPARKLARDTLLSVWMAICTLQACTDLRRGAEVTIGAKAVVEARAAERRTGRSIPYCT